MGKGIIIESNERLQVWIPPAINEEFRLYCVRNRKTLNATTAEALTQFLANESKKERRAA